MSGLKTVWGQFLCRLNNTLIPGDAATGCTVSISGPGVGYRTLHLDSQSPGCSGGIHGPPPGREISVEPEGLERAIKEREYQEEPSMPPPQTEELCRWLATN